MRNLLSNPKVRMVLALAILCLIAIITYSIPSKALARFLLIFVVSVTTEYALSSYRKVVITIPLSAIIIAEILFLIANPEGTVFQILLAIIIAISSKYYFKLGGKHVFNSAALGVFIASFFGLKITWWGLLPGIVFSTLTILLTGFVTIFTLRQEKIVISFLISALGLSFFLTRSVFLTFSQVLIGGFWFFSLVLLTETSTSPTLPKYKIFYGVFVAIASLMIPKLGITTEPLITSLLIGNLLFWYLENKMAVKQKNLSVKLPLGSKLITPE